MSFKTHAIPQSTVEALTKAKERGVEISISTGRPYALVTNIGSIEHLIDGYLTTNGAYCFIGDRFISCSLIPREDVSYVVGKTKSVGFPCMVVGEKSLTMYNTASDPEAVAKVRELLNVTGLERELPIEPTSSGILF